jgi:hypothetical protein
MFKLIGGSIAATVTVWLLVAGSLFGGVYFAAFYSKTTAETRGTTKMRENTKANGDFRQAAYQEFFNLCASVQTKENSITNLKKELDNKPPSGRVWVIDQSITALENARAEAINTYNAKANEFHRQQFLDSRLPYRLDVNQEKTECAS